MVVAAPAPISLKVAQSILNHSLMSFMGEPFDTFEATKATSAKTGSYYKWEKGAATLVSWEYGLGLTLRDGKLTREFEPEYPPTTGWLSPNQLAVQVAIAAGYA